jgi:hypothetical protein
MFLSRYISLSFSIPKLYFFHCFCFIIYSFTNFAFLFTFFS